MNRTEAERALRMAEADGIDLDGPEPPAGYERRRWALGQRARDRLAHTEGNVRLLPMTGTTVTTAPARRTTTAPPAAQANAAGQSTATEPAYADQQGHTGITPPEHAMLERPPDEPEDLAGYDIEPDPSSPRPWQPRDLDSVLDGTYVPAQPTVGARTDGLGLLYPGKVHTCASETEAGKTWFALVICQYELDAGHAVAYLDFEDDEGSIVTRLLHMGVDRDAIRQRFHYLRPDEPLGTGVHFDDLRRVITSTPRPSLVVIDGVTEAMTVHGLDPLSNSDVARFGRILARPMAAAGPAVLALDHVTKAKDGRGKYALGGVHKLNGLNGAAYTLTAVDAFGAGRTGRSRLLVAKDRPAQLRRHAIAQGIDQHWLGDLVIESSVSGQRITAAVELPMVGTRSATAPAEPTVQERVLDLVRDQPGHTTMELATVLNANRHTVTDRLKRLEHDQLVVNRGGGSKGAWHPVVPPQ